MSHPSIGLNSRQAAGIWYHLIHTDFRYSCRMPTLTDLDALVDEYASLLPDLNLDGDEQEEYSTVLLRLQNTVETGDPNERIVSECLAFLGRYLPGEPQ